MPNDVKTDTLAASGWHAGADRHPPFLPRQSKAWMADRCLPSMVFAIQVKAVDAGLRRDDGERRPGVCLYAGGYYSAFRAPFAASVWPGE